MAQTLGRILLILSLGISMCCFGEDAPEKVEFSQLVSDGRSLYAIVYDGKDSQLQELFPGRKNKSTLPASNRLKTYLLVKREQLYLLYDNWILIFSKDLELSKTIELPYSKSDYQIKKISPSGNPLVVSDFYRNAFLLNDSKLVEITKDKKFEIDGNVIEFTGPGILINGQDTGTKADSFFVLLSEFYSLSEEYIFILNNLFDKEGKIQISYPLYDFVSEALHYENTYYIITLRKLIVLSANGEILKELKAYMPKALGEYNGDIIIKLNKNSLAKISTTSLEVHTHLLTRERIGDIALVKDIIFYINKNDRSIVKKKVIDECTWEKRHSIVSNSGKEGLANELSGTIPYSYSSQLGEQGDVKKHIKKLKGDELSIKQAILYLHEKGKEAIPFLIDEIKPGEKTWNPFVNPNSSTLTSETGEIFQGVRIAYTIEMILAREKLDRKKMFEFKHVLSANPKDYIYYYGITVKKSGTPIKESDFPDVKKIYQVWWLKNKEKPLDQLRQEWHANKRPLTGTKYKWE